MERRPIYAVDFDGTLCEYAWPGIGAPNTELIDYLKVSQHTFGVRLILWTCRQGKELEAAIEWCKNSGLFFDAVNENLPDVIAGFGNDTRKIFADKYIDDRALNPNDIFWV